MDPFARKEPWKGKGPFLSKIWPFLDLFKDLCENLFENLCKVRKKGPIFCGKGPKIGPIFQKKGPIKVPSHISYKRSEEGPIACPKKVRFIGPLVFQFTWPPKVKQLKNGSVFWSETDISY